MSTGSSISDKQQKESKFQLPLMHSITSSYSSAPEILCEADYTIKEFKVGFQANYVEYLSKQTKN